MKKLKFAEIKNNSIILSYAPSKNIKNGICIQFKKALNDCSLPFCTTDIKKGQQRYSLPGTDNRNIKFIFLKQ